MQFRKTKTNPTIPLFTTQNLNEADKLSLERVLKALQSLGLSQTEARIYIFLEKNGSRESIDIAQALKLHTKELTRGLKNLQDKQIVKASAQKTVKFSAVYFEKTINLLIETKKEQALAWHESRKELIKTWQSLIEKDTSNS